MMKGDHGSTTKLLHALTWGVFNNASQAPQVKVCNHYMYIHVHVTLLHVYNYMHSTNMIVI